MAAYNNIIPLEETDAVKTEGFFVDLRIMAKYQDQGVTVMLGRGIESAPHLTQLLQLKDFTYEEMTVLKEVFRRLNKFSHTVGN